MSFYEHLMKIKGNHNLSQAIGHKMQENENFIDTLNIASTNVDLKFTKLYTKMLVKCITPDVVACTTLINEYCKKGNMQEDFNFYNEMVRRDLRPNVFTC